METQLNEEQNVAWYAIHTNPWQEERTSSNLSAWNIETFAPRVRERRNSQFNGAPQFLNKPLFSRYVFARFDLERMFHKVRHTRGVHSLVSFGASPTPIDDEIIGFIKSREGNDGFVRIGEEPLKHGDPVVIKDGTFKHLSGIFERQMKDSDRVMVLLNTISYQTRVEIDRRSIRKLMSFDEPGLRPDAEKALTARPMP